MDIGFASKIVTIIIKSAINSKVESDLSNLKSREIIHRSRGDLV